MGVPNTWPQSNHQKQTKKPVNIANNDAVDGFMMIK